ncbi:RNA polymerase sigma-70 factor [Sphingobacterium spiritivorum ATCC 33300]|uniref:RNA polymerase sigma-70 factor n=1 Tax=Sphingobacterium spiritivorum ATCC 33300 TaxID=525372 RepID=C2G323_SPHSI|nr:sigma-70 family RNA polymerase sigma factor [Sphingobacterium spiritivorum]EEI90392.1 RNA polymerase sigma-70 factor [Sphingobacterium spiritivorum ATCC 33300]QQS95311.1 sigma-70 family RNA polymerase sigma factor [Sphingobacterium spiritivorum]
MSVQHKPSVLVEYPLNTGVESDFDYIYMTYFAPLCYFASKFVDDQAVDIVNSLFAKLWTSEIVLNNANHAQSFLYLSARNACLDFIKTSGRAKERDAEFSYLYQLSEKELQLEVVYVEYMAEIYREINNLPVQCSKIIKLSYLDGVKNEKIAEQLNISVQTVKNQKSKGLKILRKLFINHPDKYLFFLFLFKL